MASLDGLGKGTAGRSRRSDPTARSSSSTAGILLCPARGGVELEGRDTSKSQQRIISAFPLFGKLHCGNLPNKIVSQVWRQTFCQSLHYAKRSRHRIWHGPDARPQLSFAQTHRETRLASVRERGVMPVKACECWVGGMCAPSSPWLWTVQDSNCHAPMA